VNRQKTDASPPLLNRESEIPVSEENILRQLARTLSIPKTLERFPSLTLQDLQALLTRSAQRAAEEAKDSSSPLFAAPTEPEWIIHADGASRGNPGEAGVGAVIADSQGRTVKELKHFLGVASNNDAEYQGAILALEKAFELGARHVVLHLDSELVVRQLKGEYRVREPHLKDLHRKALEALNRFSRYSILHISREENRRADQLANEAIDQKIKK
jgi:ribonuclease HI